MRVVSKLRLESWIAIMVTLMVCFTRLSMAAGQFFYGIAILLSIIYIWKNRNELYVPSYVKKYSKSLIVMLLLLLPSAVLTNNISVDCQNSLMYGYGEYQYFSLLLSVYAIRKHYLPCLPYSS